MATQSKKYQIKFNQGIFRLIDENNGNVVGPANDDCEIGTKPYNWRDGYFDWKGLGDGYLRRINLAKKKRWENGEL